MVNFNNETTATVAPHALIKILILQRRHDFIEAQEHYYKFLSEDVETFISLEMVIARLRSLYLETKSLVDRHWSKKEEREKFEFIFNKNKKKTIEDVVDAFIVLNSLLDKVGLLRIDTRKQYDTTNWEKSNEAFGV
jgi:hypothetical protein